MRRVLRPAARGDAGPRPGAPAPPSTTPGCSARANAKLALGKETFVGVCAKCHGLAAQGGYGPNIAQNPLLGDRNGLTNIIRHGSGKMPAVGSDWSQAQLDATIAYLHQRFAQGASGGGQG